MKEDIINSIDELEKRFVNKRIERIIKSHEKELERLKKIELFAKRDLFKLINKLDKLDLGLNSYQFEEPHSSFGEKFLVRIFVTNLSEDKINEIRDKVYEIINWVKEESVLNIANDRIYGEVLETGDELIFWVI